MKKITTGKICGHCGRSTDFHDEVTVPGYDRIYCKFCGVEDWALDMSLSATLKKRTVECEKCGKKHIYSYYDTEKIVKIDGVDVERDTKTHFEEKEAGR